MARTLKPKTAQIELPTEAMNKIAEIVANPPAPNKRLIAGIAAHNANAEVKAGRWRVQRIAGASAPLIEVKADSLMWIGPRDGSVVPAYLPKVWEGVAVKGCIAKITPPAGASDTAVASMELSFYEGGARTVRVMPAAADDKLQTPAEPATIGIDVVNRTLRQVALDRAQRVTNARDSAALVALVGEAMDHAEQT